MSYLDITVYEREQFAERVKRFRQEHGLTQKQLAAAMGMTEFTVLFLEKARYHPFPGTIARFVRLEEKYRKADELEFDALEGLS